MIDCSVTILDCLKILNIFYQQILQQWDVIFGWQDVTIVNIYA